MRSPDPCAARLRAVVACPGHLGGVGGLVEGGGRVDVQGVETL